ncbi:MAG TPA: FAD-binding oxidoreductase [Terriglobales bacterium]|nr:FAD-binding oxidoreductase [Terriglobales bacterium]
MSVVIVGGGLMGLSAAFHLRRADPALAVTVLERARIGSAASGASAAGVRAMGRDPAERRLALESLGRWPGLDRELDGETGYQRGGGLRVALDPKSWEAAPDWTAEQVADNVPLETVDAPGARRLAPGIAAACLGGVYSPIDGQARAMATVEAFATAARRLGARIEEGVGVSALSVERGRVVGVERSGSTRLPCDVAIVTAGAWTSSLLAGLGVRLPLETRPLQMLLTGSAPKSLAPVVGAFDRKLSLKQLADGAYLIGGGWPGRVVDHDENRWDVLDDSVRGSLETAGEVYPPLSGCKLARSWIGLEAFLPDELPVIGPVPGIEGLLVAAGFSGHGFALSPVVGDVLARLALGRDALLPLWRDLRFDRPALAGS